MTAEEQICQALAECGLPPVPPRSRLFSLQPLGVGTGEVESATSYLARLAAAHTVSVWNLIKHEIAPRLYGPNVVLRHRLSELVAAVGSAFNGENRTARTVTEILESLTGRHGLECTTMGFCKGFVSSRLLMRPEQGFCPECFAGWREGGKEGYSPLIWNLLAVKCCPAHRTPLLTKCPACNRSFYPLTSHTRPGFCPRCNHWLGAVQAAGGDSESTASEQAVSEIICGFLRDGPRALATVKNSEFSKNMGLLKEARFSGNLMAMARQVGVNRFSIKGWIAGRQLPSLLSLAHLSHWVGVSPVTLLSERLHPDALLALGARADGQRARLYQSPPRHDLGQVRRVLEDALREGVHPRPSLARLAKRLGCSQSTLSRRFPELAQRVKESHVEFCAIRKEVRSMMIRSSVRSATTWLHKAGEYPSLNRVQSMVPTFADTRDPIAFEEWKATMRELGLPYMDRARKVA